MSETEGDKKMWQNTQVEMDRCKGRPTTFIQIQDEFEVKITAQ